ncbi:hypothetical protein DPV78_012365 [Talaromyces pinophilus]|nr:hypothetical protein DPV78_012365 [Talaromyces pinophilus]
MGMRKGYGSLTPEQEIMDILSTPNGKMLRNLDRDSKPVEQEVVRVGFIPSSLEAVLVQALILQAFRVV